MATQPVPTGQKEFTVKKRVFNLDKFEKESLEAKGTFTPLSAIENLQGLEPAKLLTLVNAGLEKEAKKAAKATIGGASPKVVNTFVNAFRLIAPYSKMVEKDAEGAPKKDADGNVVVDRKAQTQAIYAMIKSNPVMLEGLKEAAVADSDDEDEDSGDE